MHKMIIYYNLSEDKFNLWWVKFTFVIARHGDPSNQIFKHLV